MQLQRLVLSVRDVPASVVSGTSIRSDGDWPCSFCGIRSGEWQAAIVPGSDSRPGVLACPLCELSLDLGRPTIDREAVLVWLPEYSQQAVNTLMRAVHTRLHALQESVAPEDPIVVDTPRARVLYQARALLAMRARDVQVRLGTSLPSELAAALRSLPPEGYAARELRLGGVRLLSLGRYFRDGEDVYPRVVSDWLRRESSSREGAMPSLHGGRAALGCRSLRACSGDPSDAR